MLKVRPHTKSGGPGGAVHFRSDIRKVGGGGGTVHFRSDIRKWGEGGGGQFASGPIRKVGGGGGGGQSASGPIPLFGTRKYLHVPTYVLPRYTSHPLPLQLGGMAGRRRGIKSGPVVQ